MMNLKKLISLIVISVFAVSLLCACGENGSSSKPADTPETTTAAATEAQKEPLDSEMLVDIITEDMGLSLALIDDIHVSLLDADENFTVTFKANGKDCTYVINGYTGAIVSTDIPEGAKETAAEDPFDAAINAAMNALEGYNGGAESIKVSQSGTTITVEFDWNGQHHTFHYDMNAGTLID